MVSPGHVASRIAVLVLKAAATPGAAKVRGDIPPGRRRDHRQIVGDRIAATHRCSAIRIEQPAGRAGVHQRSPQGDLQLRRVDPHAGGRGDDRAGRGHRATIHHRPAGAGSGLGCGDDQVGTAIVLHRDDQAGVGLAVDVADHRAARSGNARRDRGDGVTTLGCQNRARHQWCRQHAEALIVRDVAVQRVAAAPDPGGRIIGNRRAASDATRQAVSGLRQDHGHVLRWIGDHVGHHLPVHLRARIVAVVLKRDRRPPDVRQARRRTGQHATLERQEPASRGFIGRLLAVLAGAVILGPGPDDHRDVGGILGRRARLDPGLHRVAVAAQTPGGGVAAVARIGQERSAEPHGGDGIHALAVDAGGGRRAAVVADNAIGQCAEMPGDALGHQVPGAVVKAVAGIGLAGDQHLDTLARAHDPSSLIGKNTCDSGGVQGGVPNRRFVEPALRPACRGAVVQEQQRGAERRCQPIRRGGGNLCGIEPHIDADARGVAKDHGMGVPASQSRGQYGLLGSGKQHQPCAAILVGGEDLGPRNAQQGARGCGALPPVGPRPNQKQRPGGGGAESHRGAHQALIRIHQGKLLAGRRQVGRDDRVQSDTTQQAVQVRCGLG